LRFQAYNRFFSSQIENTKRQFYLSPALQETRIFFQFPTMTLSPPLRVHRSRSQAQAAYDRLSPVYSLLAASEAPLRRRALELLSPQPGERVLEIGCGPGETLVDLARLGADALGVDLSPGMARQARLRLDRAGCAAGVLVGDGLHLTFAAGRFSAAIMAFTLELFDTPELLQVLAEVRRVLVPGGRLAVAAMSAVDAPNAMERAYAWFHTRYPQWADCRPIPLDTLMQEAGFVLRARWQGATWGLRVGVCVGESAQ
jgi:ubiquinone/menaquinone biosynthesis C-methylase UbiE